MRWQLPIHALAASLSVAASLCAQQPAPSAAPETATLHVYVNLMQIPVLVLDQYHRPMPPIDPARFRVSIEGMQTFTPYRVRQQGDDPISLAILLDGSEPDESLWNRLPEASRQLAATLRPRDRVEVYGIDGCKLRRYLTESAFNPETLHVALANAAATKPYEQERRKLGPCASPVSLWSALYYVAATLEQRNGRRVLLTLSNGRQPMPDELGNRLRMLLNATSTTLFAIQHSESDGGYFAMGRDLGSAQGTPQGRGRGGGSLMPGTGQSSGPPLQTQSELSGGMLLGASLHSLPRVLERTIELVRGRYMVEFPRPPQLTPGHHLIDVTAGNLRQFIRPAGISVPAASNEEADALAAIQQGTGAPKGAEAEAAPPQAAPPETLAQPPTPAAEAPQTVRPPVQTPPRDPLDITDEAVPLHSRLSFQHPAEA